MEEDFSVDFCFQPTDQEILECYLYPRVISGAPLTDCFDIIHECDFYGESTELSEIWEKYGGLALEENSIRREGDIDIFFFVPLKKKTTGRKTGKNYVRTIGSGTWEGEAIDKVVADNDSMCPLGTKKRFKYINKKKPECNGLWNMMEFSLEGSDLLAKNPTLRTDLVLCRIRKNKKNLSKKRKFNETDQPTKDVVVSPDLKVPKLGNEPEATSQPNGEDLLYMNEMLQLPDLLQLPELPADDAFEINTSLPYSEFIGWFNF
ncbi:hypothetical protein ACFE04_029776 [Oxalis oulophora]